MRRRLIVLLLSGLPLIAQVLSGPGPDTNAGPTIPVRRLFSDPGVCVEGEMYYNLVSHVPKMCTATNTWSAEGYTNPTSAQNLGGLGLVTPFTAGGASIGSALLPWGVFYLGTASTNNFAITPAATAAPRAITLADPGGAATLAYLNPTTQQILGNTAVAQVTNTHPYTSFSTFSGAGWAAPTSVTDVAQEWYSALYIPSNVTLTGACFLTGSSPATDAAIVILFSSAGAVLANSALGGTVIAGASVYQCINFTGTYFAQGPQNYYIGLQTNSTHATEISTYPANGAPTNYATGTQAAGSFGTLVTIGTPASTFSAAVGPVMTVY